MATQKPKTKPRNTGLSASIRDGIRRGEKAWPKSTKTKPKVLSKGRIKKAALLERIDRKIRD